MNSVLSRVHIRNNSLQILRVLKATTESVMKIQNTRFWCETEANTGDVARTPNTCIEIKLVTEMSQP